MRIILSRGRVESSFFLIYIYYMRIIGLRFFSRAKGHGYTRWGRRRRRSGCASRRVHRPARAAAKQAAGWCGGAGVADGKVARLGGVVQLPLSPSTAPCPLPRRPRTTAPRTMHRSMASTRARHSHAAAAILVYGENLWRVYAPTNEWRR